MKNILKITTIILLLAGSFTSCEKENEPIKIPFTKYSLEETGCWWTNIAPNKVIVINSTEELKNNIDCTDGKYSEIDFSKNTLLLVRDWATNGISYIDTDFLQEAVNKYILNVNIHTDDTTVAPPWIISIIVPKIGNETIITLNVQQINN